MWRRRLVIVDAAWRDWVNPMNTDDRKVRAVIAEQASEWFVANDEAPLEARDSAALTAWFKASPVHIAEFLAVSAIARDLHEARAAADYSLDAILARARADGDSPSRPAELRLADVNLPNISRRRRIAAVALAACVMLGVGLLLAWNLKPSFYPSAGDAVTAMHFETRHGEQLSRHLPDNSVLHLNTDSAVTIRYSGRERVVRLTSGQAHFDVAHDPDRLFRVVAGAAEIIDVGTKFDVRLGRNSTLVTVVEGRVTVGPWRKLDPLQKSDNGDSSTSRQSAPFMQLSGGQQVSVVEGEWPAVATSVDAERATAWLRRDIVFDHEPLERVVTEYNRYSAKPIEITSPSLRDLQISGVFRTDDTDAFIAFLRSLKGVRVEVTEWRIRVF